MKYTPANIKMWAKMGQRGAVFGVALPDIAARKDRLKLLTADLALLSGMERFAKKYPDKFLNVGIAEQNMIGIAAGLAMDGYCVFASTYSSFIAVRSLEQVRQNLAHMGCNVKLIGSSAGTAAAKSGISAGPAQYDGTLPSGQPGSRQDGPVGGGCGGAAVPPAERRAELPHCL